MKKFSEFDKENPEIWYMFKLVATRLISEGHKEIGAKRICEEIRWHHTTIAGGGFKFGNAYTPYYARKFVSEFPQFKNLFKFKKLKNQKNYYIAVS